MFLVMVTGADRTVVPSSPHFSVAIALLLAPVAIGYRSCDDFIRHVRDVGEGADDGPLGRAWPASHPATR
jgi:hypothetical protein